METRFDDLPSPTVSGPCPTAAVSDDESDFDLVDFDVDGDSCLEDSDLEDSHLEDFGLDASNFNSDVSDFRDDFDSDRLDLDRGGLDDVGDDGIGDGDVDVDPAVQDLAPRDRGAPGGLHDEVAATCIIQSDATKAGVGQKRVHTSSIKKTLQASSAPKQCLNSKGIHIVDVIRGKARFGFGRGGWGGWGGSDESSQTKMVFFLCKLLEDIRLA